MQSTWRRLAERPQPLADGAGGLAADAGVDLVEHERRADSPAPATLISASITRESSPPDAVSRSGAGRHARVGRDHELDPLGAASGRSPRAARAATSNVGALHRQRAPARSRTALGQPRRRRAPRARSSCAGQPRRARASASASSRLGAARSPPRRRSSRVALGAAALGVREHGRDVPPCLRLSRS